MSDHERAEAALITRPVAQHPTRGSGRATQTLAAAVLASALLAALAPAANATTTVSYAPGGANAGLTITGGGQSLQRQDVDRLFISAGQTPNEQFMTVRANAGAASVTPGSGCFRSGANEVRCSVTGVRIITARLGSGDDDLTVGSNDDSFVRGGPGNDVISGGGGADAIDGDEGNDTLRGGSGFGSDVLSGGDGIDTFPISDTGGADVFNGGAAFDTVSFAAPNGVSVSLDDVRNDGAQDLSNVIPDNVKSDVENVVGTAGNDVLIGSAAANRLEGVAGDDTLRGGDGGDTLDGGLGADVLGGEGGDDLLLARDGVNDQSGAAMSCGTGRFDGVVADLKDDDTRPIPADCERVDLSDRREGPNVVVRSRSVSVGRDGVLSVRLSCPRKLRRSCSGSLASRVDKRGTGFGRRTRYSIRPGRSARVKTRLRASQRAAARRRGARVVVRSLERGLLGTKTTLRPLPARRA